jgi:hypothetical protein
LEEKMVDRLKGWLIGEKMADCLREWLIGGEDG